MCPKPLQKPGFLPSQCPNTQNPAQQTRRGFSLLCSSGYFTPTQAF